MRPSHMLRLMLFASLLFRAEIVVGEWKVEESVDELLGTSSTTAFVEANKAHADSWGEKPLFVAVCNSEGKLSLRIDWQTYIDDDSFETLAKLDDGPVIELWTSSSARGTSVFLGRGRQDQVFLTKGAAPSKYLGVKNTKANTSQLNERLKQARKVVFRQFDYRGVQYTAVFNFEGYSSISDSALSACNLNTPKVSAIVPSTPLGVSVREVTSSSSSGSSKVVEVVEILGKSGRYFKAGDQIKTLDGTDITSLRVFNDVVRSLPRAKAFGVKIVRKNSTNYISVKI